MTYEPKSIYVAGPGTERLFGDFASAQWWERAYGIAAMEGHVIIPFMLSSDFLR
jgi:hypothetical protein